MDRTLTRSGTWSRYVFQVNKTRASFYARLPLLGLHALAYKLGFSSRRSLKEHGLKTLTWAPRKLLEQAADPFAEREVETGLRSQALSVLARHREAGDRLILATADADLVAQSMARKLGFDLVICTQLEYANQGYLTSKILGADCYGSEKLDAVKQIDTADFFARPIWGYSDHVSDHSFLNWVDIGVAVNPSNRFARIASKSGLSIQDWDETSKGEEDG